MPKFRKIKAPQARPHPITSEHFELVYTVCDAAKMPQGAPYDVAVWWRAILVFAMTTGWRKEEILAFRRDDLDFDTGAVLTRAENNKGGRDDMDHLPQPTLEHLRIIVSFSPVVFPWPHDLPTVDVRFQRIQVAAGGATAQDGHKDVQTTMRYVEMARKMKKAAENVYVPAFLRAAN